MKDNNHFIFDDYDKEISQVIHDTIKYLFKTANLTPHDIVSLGRTLFSLENLPSSTPGIHIECVLKLPGIDEPKAYSSWSIVMTEETFSVYSGGYSYDPRIGGDHYTIYNYEIEIGGFKESNIDIYRWSDEYIEAINMGAIIQIYDGSDLRIIQI